VLTRRTTIPAALLLAAAGLATTGSASAAAPLCHGHAATIVGTSGSDHIMGTAHRDVIVGLGGNDTISAGGGADLVCGGAGADHLSGGKGDDHLYGETDRVFSNDGVFVVGDTLAGGPGNDLLDPGFDPGPTDADRTPDLITYQGAAQGVTVDLSAGTATGEGHDRLVVGDNPLRLVGSGHSDRITGRPVDDVIDPGRGHDRVSTGDGTDTVHVLGPSTGHSTVDLGPGNDALIAGGGHVTVHAGPGDDGITSHSAVAVHIFGGPGSDQGQVRVASRTTLRGGGGWDYLIMALKPSSGRVTYHAANGRFDFGGGKHAVATGLETYDFSGTVKDLLTFDGTANDDEVWVHGMTVHASLAGGDDTLVSVDDPVSKRQADDVVRGGPGTDFANAVGGHNTCTSVEEGPC